MGIKIIIVLITLLIRSLTTVSYFLKVSDHFWPKTFITGQMKPLVLQHETTAWFSFLMIIFDDFDCFFSSIAGDVSTCDLR